MLPDHLIWYQAKSGVAMNRKAVWLVAVLLSGAGLWSVHEKRVGDLTADQAARKKKSDAASLVLAEKRKQRCAPVLEAEQVLRDGGRVDLIKTKPNRDFCRQLMSSECGSIAEVRFELVRLGRKDLSDAAGSWLKCDGQLKFMTEFGAEAFKAHLALEAESIEAAIDNHECDRLSDDREPLEPEY